VKTKLNNRLKFSTPHRQLYRNFYNNCKAIQKKCTMLYTINNHQKKRKIYKSVITKITQKIILMEVIKIETIKELNINR
jgi:hypothetical protein